jgi:hypothetical protein
MLKIKKSPSGVPIAIGIGAGIKKRNLTTKEHEVKETNHGGYGVARKIRINRRGTQRRRN